MPPAEQQSVLEKGREPPVRRAPPRRPTPGRGQLSPRQREILALLNDGIKVKGIASRLGLHETTVRNHIRRTLRKLDCHSQLEAVALARQEGILPGAPGERGESPAEGYRLLAEILASCLSGTGLPADPGETGRAWGRELARMERRDAHRSRDGGMAELLAFLKELGFEPEEAAGGDAILLHRCPFGDVARAHQEVVCSTHFGLVQGALAELDCGLEATALEPFVAPGLCAVRLNRWSETA